MQDKGNHVGLLELFSWSSLCVHLPADTKQECNVFDEIFLYWWCINGSDQVVMDNGIARVTLSKPDGIVTGIEYNGIDNLLEVLNEESNRG